MKLGIPKSYSAIYGWVQARSHDLVPTIGSAIEFYIDMVLLDIFGVILWPVETLPGLGVISRAFLKNVVI